MVHFHFERVATTFGGISRRVSENVKFIFLAPDFLEPSEQVVGVKNREAAGSFRQGSKNLLVGGRGRRKGRHDGPRLAVSGIVEIRIGGHSAAARPTTCATAARTAAG